MINIKNALFSLGGVGVLLGLAYGIDTLVHRMQVNAGRDFNIAPVFWVNSIGNLIFMSACLLLFWFIRFKLEYSRVTAVLFTLIGFFLLFYNGVALSLPTSRLSLLLALAPETFLLLASAFVAVTGLINLFLPPKPDN